MPLGSLGTLWGCDRQERLGWREERGEERVGLGRVGSGRESLFRSLPLTRQDSLITGAVSALFWQPLAWEGGVLSVFVQ